MDNGKNIDVINIYLRFSEDHYNKVAMVNFLICTRKIGDTFKSLTQLGQTKHGVDAVCNYKQADMSAMFTNVMNGEYFTRRCRLPLETSIFWILSIIAYMSEAGHGRQDADMYSG